MSTGVLIEGVNPPETATPANPSSAPVHVSFNNNNNNGWSLKKVLGIGAIVLVVLACVGGGGFYASNKKAKEPIRCFECFASSANTSNDYDVPKEKDCMDAPQNSKQCKIGQLCIVVRLKHSDGTLFFRKCANSTERLGCVDLKPPKVGHMCLCDKDLCKI